jgi:hypothetical protein
LTLKNLAPFFASDDADDIIAAFVAIPQGPLRVAVVAHIKSLAAVTAPIPEPEAIPLYDPDWRKKLLQDGPISESIAGRVAERHFAGMAPSKIARVEGIPVEDVKRYIEDAKAAQEPKAPKAPKAPKETKTAPRRRYEGATSVKDFSPEIRTQIKQHAVGLRLEGVAPSVIAARLTRSFGKPIDGQLVHNAVFEAKTKKELPKELPPITVTKDDGVTMIDLPIWLPERELAQA